MRFLTRVALKIYFRRWSYHFSYPIPEDASIIYAANHQNAFMDAIALIDSQTKRPTWLTRAAMFKTSFARFWFDAMRMIPIYRTRDGIRNVSKNKETIEKCIQLLVEEKQPIGIFPEGNHHINMTLRSPLQKGIARIAFDAASSAQDPSKLYILPVGFSYSDGLKFRSNLFIHYGDPICVGDYYEKWKESPARTIRELLKEISKRLSDQMIDIKTENYYETLDTWRKYKRKFPSQFEEFKEDKKLIEEIESGKLDRSNFLF
jgi:1-acyl-sn-glycerol-3-phosphate acyltransferase